MPEARGLLTSRLSLATVHRDVPPHITPSLSEDLTLHTCPGHIQNLGVPSWSASDILQAPTGHKDLTSGSKVLGRFWASWRFLD